MDWKTRNNQTTSSWRNNKGLGGSGGGKPPRGLKKDKPGCFGVALLVLTALSLIGYGGHLWFF